MAILMRGGGYLDFDPSKLRPREWAVVLQGDPSARDGKAVYICFAAGNVKRISTYEDMKDDLITATDDVIEQYVQVFGEIKTEVERLRSETLGYKNAAQEKATEAANSAQTASEKSQAASVSATNAANSADLSDIHSKMSESYAVGTNGEIRGNDETDNSKYYKEECQRLYQNIEQLISSVTTGGLIPAGTVRFIELPDVPNIGYMYNISDDFVTDDRFEEGEGKYYSSGTNVYWTANAKWDVLTGVAVLGVKGESEALYQTGYVVITKESIGLDKVENKTSREILDGLTATDVTNALGYIPGSEDGGVTGVKGGNETEYRKGNVNITKENIGLGSVENKSSEDIRAEITAENIENALGYVPGSGSGNVTGVKGEAEETYRSGNVNIAKSDIGLGNVDNTSDADKPVSTAQQTELDKKANKVDIVLNSRLDDGYVLKGEGNPNKVWGTDENGNPGWMDMPKGGGRTLSDCENISAESTANGVSLMWTDPRNLVFNDEVVAQWAGTKVVRKEGTRPTSVDDGVLVADSTVKDAHKTSPLVDTGAVTDGVKYNYLLCPYTTDGVVTESDFSRVNIMAKTAFDLVLENNTWEDIKKAAVNGVAMDYWSVGDTKKLVHMGYKNALYNVTARIIGFNHETSIDGTENVPSITFALDEVLNSYNGSGYTEPYQYGNSSMSPFYFPSMFSGFGSSYNSSDLMSYLMYTKRQYRARSSSSANKYLGTTYTIDADASHRFFLLTMTELGLGSNDGEGKVYEGYSTGKCPIKRVNETDGKSSYAITNTPSGSGQYQWYVTNPYSDSASSASVNSTSYKSNLHSPCYFALGDPCYDTMN